MDNILTSLPDEIIVLVNGNFPTHSIPLRTIATARYLVCTDGSADQALYHGYVPDLVIGDMDSTVLSASNPGIKFITVASQENTDLEKTLDWLAAKQAVKIKLLGLTGLRDDHALANFLILANYSHLLEIQVITDHFTIDYITSRQQLAVTAGQTVSIVALTPVKRITVTGIQFPLDDEYLKPCGHGISNIATGSMIAIDTSDPILIFRAHRK